ncbi:hypothetical protein SKAU_G00021410 [Synaphobranchus kaupii]|uniref:Uncharacterized protein n=1 Tax=Synaphobranchus kaupii TaxID=118154 RepID=A0A9Q1GD39_SYNKA|nr:hypothetical protein SKAU_G00021410 [Synaphobranchus kaupii]
MSSKEALSLKDCCDKTEEGSISFNTHTAKKRSSKPESGDRWHEDVQPHQFCFCPQRTPGAQLDCRQDYSPPELFCSKEAVLILCQNTSSYVLHVWIGLGMFLDT